MINWVEEQPVQTDNRQTRMIRTDWKNHRNEALIGNCSACGTPVVIETFRVLCPRQFQSLFGSSNVY